VVKKLYIKSFVSPLTFHQSKFSPGKIKHDQYSIRYIDKSKQEKNPENKTEYRNTAGPENATRS
jgi:hypothetical protein